MKNIITLFLLQLICCSLYAQNVGNKATYEVKSKGVILQLSETGNITGLLLEGSKPNWISSGVTLLKGMHTQGEVTLNQPKSTNASIFTRTVVDSVGHSCVVTDIFTPENGSIRWDITLTSKDAPWSTAIITQMRCAQPEEKLFWTAWGSPDFSGTESNPKLKTMVQNSKESVRGSWSDPLTPVGFVNHIWQYGNTKQAIPVDNDFISLPLFTLLSPSTDNGLSLVLSPQDTLLDMELSVSQTGQFLFARTNHRLGSGKTIRFSMHLVAHEASWRGGLRFMNQRYPEYFEAPNKRVHTIAACGAYSGSESPIDVARMKKMAFGFNWKLSDDFPYMGMFIPPVKNSDVKWKRSCAEPRPEGKPDSTSCRQLNDYAKYMKLNGFSVLNYFNVTEYGKDVNPDIEELSKDKAADPELWKNCSEYMRVNFPKAWLKVTSSIKTVNSNPLVPVITTDLPGGIKGIMSNCYGAAIVDPGDPEYLKFILDQAQRHIKFVPESDGICIDRTDWLSLYNSMADDGVSWKDGKPARSLYLSWAALMSKMAPMMHESDKVIFSNLMTMRLELSRQLDGIYTEFGNNGNALNGSALIGIRKPVVAWTYNETLQDPDPDAFMQRNLYLGVFPTAPYPTNNHCIIPETKADQLYVDYGLLLNAMRGKKWVLESNCVETTTKGVKVNLFEVPGGYALPVAFGGKAKSAIVRVRNLKDLSFAKITVLHPGTEIEVPVASAFKDGFLEFVVPLKRGCAMVKIETMKK